MDSNYDETEIQETIYEASQWIQKVLNENHQGSRAALVVRLFEQDIKEFSEIDDNDQYQFDTVLIWNTAVSNIESYAKLEIIEVNIIPELHSE